MTSRKLKPTAGPWTPRRLANYADPGWVILWPGKGGLYSNQLDSLGYFHGDDARLIAEAGTVFHECGLSPRELLEAVRELHEALATIYDQCGGYVPDTYTSAWSEAFSALAKHKEV